MITSLKPIPYCTTLTQQRRQQKISSTQMPIIRYVLLLISFYFLRLFSVHSVKLIIVVWKTLQSEYVLGDYVNTTEQVGSRRISERPPQVQIASPANHAATKRRRVSMKIPHSVPFQQYWFENALVQASSEDLHIMLSMLEKKEIDIISAIELTEKSLAMGEELEARLKLEMEFEDLCNKEKNIYNQITELKSIEAAS